MKNGVGMRVRNRRWRPAGSEDALRSGNEEAHQAKVESLKRSWARIANWFYLGGLAWIRASRQMELIKKVQFLNQSVGSASGGKLAFAE